MDEARVIAQYVDSVSQGREGAGRWERLAVALCLEMGRLTAAIWKIRRERRASG